MMYKGVNFLTTNLSKKQEVALKQLAEKYIESKAVSKTAIIGSELKVESNNYKIFNAELAIFHEIDMFNKVCFIKNNYLITNKNNDIVFVYPNYYAIEPQFNIKSKEFINTKNFTKKETQTIGELSSLVSYLTNINEKKQLQK